MLIEIINIIEILSLAFLIIAALGCPLLMIGLIVYSWFEKPMIIQQGEHSI